MPFGLVKEQPLGACKISSFGQASSKAVWDPFDQGQYIPNDADQIILSGASRTLEDSGISCFSHFYVVRHFNRQGHHLLAYKIRPPQIHFPDYKIHKQVYINKITIDMCEREMCFF